METNFLVLSKSQQTYNSVGNLHTAVSVNTKGFTFTAPHTNANSWHHFLSPGNGSMQAKEVSKSSGMKSLIGYLGYCGTVELPATEVGLILEFQLQATLNFVL